MFSNDTFLETLVKEAKKFDWKGDHHPEHPGAKIFDSDKTVVDNGRDNTEQFKIKKSLDERKHGNPEVESKFLESKSNETDIVISENAEKIKPPIKAKNTTKDTDAVINPTALKEPMKLDNIDSSVTEGGNIYEIKEKNKKADVKVETINKQSSLPTLQDDKNYLNIDTEKVPENLRPFLRKRVEDQRFEFENIPAYKRKYLKEDKNSNKTSCASVRNATEINGNTFLIEVDASFDVINNIGNEIKVAGDIKDIIKNSKTNMSLKVEAISKEEALSLVSNIFKYNGIDTYDEENHEIHGFDDEIEHLDFDVEEKETKYDIDYESLGKAIFSGKVNEEELIEFANNNKDLLVDLGVDVDELERFLNSINKKSTSEIDICKEAEDKAVLEKLEKILKEHKMTPEGLINLIDKEKNILSELISDFNKIKKDVSEVQEDLETFSK